MCVNVVVAAATKRGARTSNKTALTTANSKYTSTITSINERVEWEIQIIEGLQAGEEGVIEGGGGCVKSGERVSVVVVGGWGQQIIRKILRVSGGVGERIYR